MTPATHTDSYTKTGRAAVRSLLAYGGPPHNFTGLHPARATANLNGWGRPRDGGGANLKGGRPGLKGREAHVKGGGAGGEHCETGAGGYMASR